MSAAVFGKDTVTGSNDAVAISSNSLHVAQYVWDTATLSWVRQSTGGTGTGGEVVVTNSSIPVSQNGAWNVSITFPTYSKRYDQADSTTAYLGNAAIGASEGSSVWQIQKLVFGVDGDVTVTWADGDNLFNNSWTNRASLSYS